MQRELRYLKSAELRANNARRISGYAAVFNQWSEDLGGFIEKVAPGAFSRAIQGADVRALFNHDSNIVLGRTRSGTLKLRQDSVGLHFDVALPETSAARSLHTLIKRGDVSECSFGFSVRKDSWNPAGTERTLTDVDLYDVGPVTFSAYTQTSVEARSNPGCYGAGCPKGIYKFPADPKLRLLQMDCKIRLALCELEDLRASK